MRHQVAVIVHGGVSPRAAITATSAIPIVSTFGGDPVRLGFVKSINRPGGNITGVSLFAADLEAKRLELLRELLPTAKLIGVLHDPSFSEAGTQLQEVEGAALAMGITILSAPPRAKARSMQHLRASPKCKCRRFWSLVVRCSTAGVFRLSR